jgi:hypothetical protein
MLEREGSFAASITPMLEREWQLAALRTPMLVSAWIFAALKCLFYQGSRSLSLSIPAFHLVIGEN